MRGRGGARWGRHDRGACWRSSSGSCRARRVGRGDAGRARRRSRRRARRARSARARVRLRARASLDVARAVAALRVWRVSCAASARRRAPLAVSTAPGRLQRRAGLVDRGARLRLLPRGRRGLTSHRAARVAELWRSWPVAGGPCGGLAMLALGLGAGAPAVGAGGRRRVPLVVARLARPVSARWPSLATAFATCLAIFVVAVGTYAAFPRSRPTSRRRNAPDPLLGEPDRVDGSRTSGSCSSAALLGARADRRGVRAAAGLPGGAGGGAARAHDLAHDRDRERVRDGAAGGGGEDGHRGPLRIASGGACGRGGWLASAGAVTAIRAGKQSHREGLGPRRLAGVRGASSAI